MKTSEFLRWLKDKGATFDTRKGKGSHIRVTLNGKQTVVPSHSKDLIKGERYSGSPVGVERNHSLRVAFFLRKSHLAQCQKHHTNWRTALMLQYPARLKSDKNGGFIVTFRDIPEAITQGEDADDALKHAQDALETAMEFYFDDRREVPMPSAPKRGDRLVALPVSESFKVLLLNEMVKQGVRPAELAKRMNTSKQEINRLTTLRHTTKVDRIADALAALGKRLTVNLNAA
jgi:antitoxin HicB